MNTTSRRPGFTLVEMLIVLGIIVSVAAIFIPVALNMSERNQVAKGASMLENALALAKARAVSEKRPNGVRLTIAPNNLRALTSGAGFAWYNQIQYIESPSDYVENWFWGLADTTTQVVTQPFWAHSPPIIPPENPAPSPGALPQGYDNVAVALGPFNFPVNSLVVDSGGTTNTSAVAVARSFCLFGPISPPGNQWTASGGTYLSQRLQFNPVASSPFSIQPGDKVELDGVGELFTVFALSVANTDITSTDATAQAAAPSSGIVVPVIILDRALPNNISVPLNGKANYRIIRQPRAISSLNPVKLPQDVVIDLTPSRVNFPSAGAGSDVDTTNSIYMSNVSAGVGVTAISGLTTPNQNLVAPDYIDIMFAPSGEIMPTSQSFSSSGTNVGQSSVGQSGLIALWVHSRGDPNLWAARQITAAQGNADNQAIVAINGRTGFIGSYPINTATGDPLANARLGKARISADTGQ